MAGKEISSKSDRRKTIRKHTDLEVYQQAFDVAMKVFELTKRVPREETYSLTDQIRRSSRSVCANLAEGWRKRRYPLSFASKLIDSEAEASETQTWLQFAVKCENISRDAAADLYRRYDMIIGKLVVMVTRPDQWKL